MDEIPIETVVQSKNEDTSDGSKRHTHTQGHVTIRKQSICTQQADVTYWQSRRRDSNSRNLCHECVPVRASFERFPRDSDDDHHRSHCLIAREFIVNSFLDAGKVAGE